MELIQTSTIKFLGNDIEINIADRTDPLVLTILLMMSVCNDQGINPSLFYSKMKDLGLTFNGQKTRDSVEKAVSNVSDKTYTVNFLGKEITVDNETSKIYLIILSIIEIKYGEGFEFYTTMKKDFKLILSEKDETLIQNIILANRKNKF